MKSVFRIFAGAVILILTLIVFKTWSFDLALIMASTPFIRHQANTSLPSGTDIGQDEIKSGNNNQVASMLFGTELELRKQTAVIGCEKLQADPKPLKWLGKNINDNFIMDKNATFAYCHIPKVASTWWHRAFGRIHGYTEQYLKENQRNIQGWLFNKPLKLSNLPDSTFRFIFVRHPLARLVSCYLSKFKAKTVEKQFEKPLKKWLLDNHFEDPKDLSFSNFVDFVLDESEYGRVSFGSLHWIPISSLCRFCESRFDFIGKIENFKQDVQVLSSMFPEIAEITGNMNSKINGGEKNFLDYKLYLHQLSSEQVKALCQLYYWDLVLLDYSCLEF